MTGFKLHRKQKQQNSSILDKIMLKYNMEETTYGNNKL